MKKLFCIITLTCISMLVVAQKKNIVLNYDFKAVDGMVVKDKGPFHADANLINGALVEDGCLILSADEAYLDMTVKAGEIMSRLSDFTVYARYFISPETKVKGYGYFLWCFSKLEANKEKDGPYHAYRVNEQRCETSIGGWSQETGIQKSRVTALGKWVTVLFRQANGKGELYIDGELVGTEEGFPELKSIFADAPRHNWIGKAPFAGDNYLKNAKVSDFRVYDKCLTDKEMRKINLTTKK